MILIWPPPPPPSRSIRSFYKFSSRFPSFMVLRNFNFNFIRNRHKQQIMEFNSSNNIEFLSKSNWLHFSFFVHFFTHPKPSNSSSSNAWRTWIRQKPNPNTNISIRSQIWIWENPHNINGTPDPIPANK